MIDINEFFTKLKESIEKCSQHLRRGQIFLPQYLEGQKLERAFSPVTHSLAGALNLKLGMQIQNTFLPQYEIGGNQRVDFVFYERTKGKTPLLFLELESLDGSQLFHFREHKGIRKKNNYNKLWYYYGTIGNYYTLGEKVPKYVVWLLTLPDRQVEPYDNNLWDIKRLYKMFHQSLKELVYESPYRFYDHLIKTSARMFLQKEQEFQDPRTKRWARKRLIEFQDVTVASHKNLFES